jgi:hypothetical protein
MPTIDNEASPNGGASLRLERERYRELSDSGQLALGEEPKRRPFLRFHAACRVDRRAAVPLPGHTLPGVGVEHEIKVRDLRLRFGAPDVYAAQCSSGWLGEERRGPAAARNAHLDGQCHLDSERAKWRRRPSG